MILSRFLLLASADSNVAFFSLIIYFTKLTQLEVLYTVQLLLVSILRNSQWRGLLCQFQLYNHYSFL